MNHNGPDVNGEVDWFQEVSDSLGLFNCELAVLSVSNFSGGTQVPVSQSTFTVQSGRHMPSGVQDHPGGSRERKGRQKGHQGL